MIVKRCIIERLVPNAAKLTNTCQHFDVPCLSLEEFVQQEGRQF